MKLYLFVQESHFDEYCQYDLGELAPSLVGPLVTSALASWQPLTSPHQYKDIFEQWKYILEKPLQKMQQLGIYDPSRNNGILPYDSLVWHNWVPVIKSCIK